MKTKLHELTDRWAAMLLVLVIIFLLFAGPLSQKADAVVVSSVIVGAVIATMALAGITFVASGMTAAQLQDWVSEKLNEWAADLESPLDHLINSAGIGVTISGLLSIGTAAAQGINQFITWLKNELGLVDNTTASVIDNEGFNLGDYFIIDTSSTNAPSYTYTNNYIIYQLSGSSVQSIYLRNNVDVHSVSFDIHFRLYNTDWCYPLRVYSLINGNPSNSNVVYSNLVNCTSQYDNGQAIFCGVQNGIGSAHVEFSENNSANTGFLLQSRAINRGNSAVDIYISNFIINGNAVTETNESLDIETGVITLPQVQNDDKVFLDVGALPGSTVTDVTDGVIEDAVTNTLDVSGEVAEEEPEYVIDGPEPVYGLADVFPFCIPFDLYDFVSCLAADPVAPHFEWRLYVEDLVDYTFVIDLQQFETVAQIFRTMFLLAFIIGLAMVTRHLLRS